MHLSLKSLYHNQSHTFSGFLSTTKCLCPRSLAYHIISSKVPPQHRKYAILWSHIINSRFKQSNLFAFPTNILSSVDNNLYWSLTPQSFPVLLFSPLLKILFSSSFIWHPLFHSLHFSFFHSFSFFHYIPVYVWSLLTSFSKLWDRIIRPSSALL